MLFGRGGETVPLVDPPEVNVPALRSVAVNGEGRPITELVVPSEGRRVSGDDLLKLLDTWVAYGIVEPGFAYAVAWSRATRSGSTPPDTSVVVLGAGAEMGPAYSLLRWGGRWSPSTCPTRRLWQRLVAWTRESGGSLEVPVPVEAPTSMDDKNWPPRLAPT